MTNWSDIGKTLRTTRESRGSSIHDVAHYTRIPVRALHELEEGDYSGFASPAYAKGFLGQYAAHLNVDASEWLDDFEVTQAPLDLKNYEFLNDQDEELSPLPSHPLRAQTRLEARTRPRVSSAALQPLAIFLATAMLISAGVYGFVKLNERLGPVTAEEAPGAPSPPATQPVESPRSDRSAAMQNGPGAVSPPLAAHNTPQPNTLPPVLLNEESSQPRSIDTKPPRAVIVEE